MSGQLRIRETPGVARVRRATVGAPKHIFGLALALAVGACGGDGGDSAAAGDSPAPEAVEAPSVADRLAGCEQPAGPPPMGATLADRAGAYQVVMIEAGEAGRRTTGQLTLAMQENSELTTWDAAATPLYGWTDLDVEAVGAHEVGALDTTDPAAPGVLVLETAGADAPRILVRFGASANTRGRAAFDGGYTVFTVLQLEDDGFSGSWRSAAQGPMTQGYFCAVAE